MKADALYEASQDALSNAASKLESAVQALRRAPEIVSPGHLMAQRLAARRALQAQFDLAEAEETDVHEFFDFLHGRMPFVRENLLLAKLLLFAFGGECVDPNTGEPHTIVLQELPEPTGWFIYPN